MFMLFLLMLRLTPKSTLFPYTTLFRSIIDNGGGFVPGKTETPPDRGMGTRIMRYRADGLGAKLEITSAPDRKSTRLNSSHRCISYAVFCLKKKNIIQSLLLWCLNLVML